MLLHRQRCLRRTTVEQREQLRFEWAGQSEIRESREIVLDRETIEEVIAWMARALVAIVRAAETDDER
jgi:hypothetical protein